MDTIYIKRRLAFEHRTIAEDEVLQLARYIVVLAEPGAGKTKLLSNFATQLNSERIRASIFRHDNDDSHKELLIIDGLDEVAKLDNSAIDAIIVKAGRKKPQRVVFASRSSEWDEARYKGFIRDCLGEEPKTVRLLPFDEDEQRALFSDHLPAECFEDFLIQTERFRLNSLLGNPQFLKLFADAYVENGRVFGSKRQIFNHAIMRLSREENEDISRNGRPSTDHLMYYAADVFAKLMLSGATGISQSEASTSQDFPLLFSISSIDIQKLNFLLDTQLLKPVGKPGLHEPIHRIVAEYSAASYLARRVGDASDQLTLRRCLSVIAPNSVVRDELRGLIGWLASLGNKDIQVATIDLDPYAVLANGDPSQLLESSKRRLLQRLGEHASVDPYFRRGDFGRTFSTEGFFSPGVLEEFRQQLSTSVEGDHFRGLLLEALAGSDVASAFESDLIGLLLDPNNSLNTRLLAIRNLFSIPAWDHTPTFEALLQEASSDALSILSRMVIELGVEAFGRPRLIELLRSLATLYPTKRRGRERDIGSRYFIKGLPGSFSLDDTEWFLDRLSEGLSCTCGAEERFECTCRNGISKVIGGLMDRYFELSEGRFVSVQVWNWVKNLNFHNLISVDKSSAVRELQSNENLRQEIQVLMFDGADDPEEIWDIRGSFFTDRAHAGLNFSQSDRRHMVDYAFEASRPQLWGAFYQAHNIHVTERVCDDLRAHMREQAHMKPEFLCVWSQRERASARFRKTQRRPRFRFQRRRENRENKIKAANLEHLKANRSLIERGQHWGWLQAFAHSYLQNAESLSGEVDDQQLPERALQNSLPFLENNLPTLARLGELARENHYLDIVKVLHAACLAIYRHSGSLVELSEATLQALKTDIDTSYQAISNDDRDAFEAEVNRCLFKCTDSIERFARTYIEPQLSIMHDGHTSVGWLRYKPEFEPIRSTLPLEWLGRFSDMPYSAMSTLFDLAAQYDDRETLCALITQRCREIMDSWPNGPLTLEQERRRDFWFLRSFFFIEEENEFAWKDLKQYSDTIFMPEHIAGSFNRGDFESWPTLRAEKIYNILDAFVDVWPKVSLPSSYGSGSPDDERAYRFLTEVVWSIGKDAPNSAIPILDRILSQAQFSDFHGPSQNMRVEAARRMALWNFQAPRPDEIVRLLDQNRIASVEDLRAFMVEELERLQNWQRGADTDPLEVFYDGGSRVSENTARDRIVERLEDRLKALNMSVTIERHMANSKRCDFTAETVLDGRRNLLVIEVKGQWHSDLYKAAATQLYERYSHHPDAAHQGIYLVLWFGDGEKIAGRKNKSITSPSALRQAIQNKMPKELHGSIDVFVMDLSRAWKEASAG